MRKPRHEQRAMKDTPVTQLQIKHVFQLRNALVLGRVAPNPTARALEPS